MRQITMGEVTPEYQAFVDKFKPKLTTDDCSTPENVYDVVRAWVFDHYGLPENTPVIRPFWPGVDYQRAEYPDGCVVIDNPPFSILAKIEQFYLANGIRFFMFAPGLSLFKSDMRLHYVCCGASVTYANGAKVNTSFVTNLGAVMLQTAPDLTVIIAAENKKNEKALVKQYPKYAYPPEVVTAAMCNYYAQHGVVYRLCNDDAHFIRKLDAQKGKGIFGAGFLVSQKAAAKKATIEKAAIEKAAIEKAAIEKASAIRWELSDREKAIVDKLG